MARHWSLEVVDRGFDLEQAFTNFFVADIIVRVACHGLKFFSFCWNVFDLIIISLQLLNQYLKTTSMIYLITFRLIRRWRVIRTVKAFNNLRIVGVCIARSMVPLASLFFLLFLVIYFSGVFITEIVTTYKVSVGRSAMESDEDLIILEEYYGSLSRTMLMLYMVVTEGTEWQLLVDPLGCTLMYRIWHEVIQSKGSATYEEMGKSGVSCLH